MSPSEDLKALASAMSAEKLASCVPLQGEAGRTCRNTLVTARKYAIDLKFSEFEETLSRQTREAGFFTTIVSLGLTGGATFVRLTASHILSAIATGVTGTRAAYEKEILAEKTLTVIHTAMRANRAKIAVRLLSGLQKDVDAYPLPVALSDLDAYYNAGTILGALVGITEAVGVEAQRAEENLTIISGVARHSAAVWLQTFVAGASTPEERTRRRERIKTEMVGLGVAPSTPVTVFINDSKEETRPLQEKVAITLGWPPEPTRRNVP